MNLKAIITAAAIALLPVTASALTLVNDGDSVTIPDDDTAFLALPTTAGGPGSFTVTFTSSLDPLTGGALATIGPRTAGSFTDLTMEWVSLVNGVLDSTPVSATETSLLTTFASPGDLVQNLVISWSDSSLAGAGFDVEISLVPLPAGVILMGTALAGFGVMRRRKLHS